MLKFKNPKFSLSYRYNLSIRFRAHKFIVVKDCRKGKIRFLRVLPTGGMHGHFIHAGAGGFEFFPFEAVYVRQVKSFSSTHNLYAMEEENEKV